MHVKSRAVDRGRDSGVTLSTRTQDSGVGGSAS